MGVAGEKMLEKRGSVQAAQGRKGPAVQHAKQTVQGRKRPAVQRACIARRRRQGKVCVHPRPPMLRESGVVV